MAKGTRGRAAADRRVAQKRADGELANLIAELGYDPDDTSIDRSLVLARRMTHAHFMCEALEDLVGQLATKPDLEVRGGVLVATAEALYGPDHLGDLKAHPLMGLLAEWTEKAARYSKLAHDVGIDERRLVLDEAERAMMLDFTEALLLAVAPDLGIDLADVDVRAKLADKARAIEARSSEAPPSEAS